MICQAHWNLFLKIWLQPKILNNFTFENCGNGYGFCNFYLTVLLALL